MILHVYSTMGTVNITFIWHDEGGEGSPLYGGDGVHAHQRMVSWERVILGLYRGWAAHVKSFIIFFNGPVLIQMIKHPEKLINISKIQNLDG